MSTIDTSGWTKFKLKELFDIKLSHDDLQPQKLSEGTMPLVSSGKTNNGITMIISDDSNSEIFPGNTMTVDMFGKVFYQKDDFYAVSHGRVNILLPKFNMTEEIGLALSALLEKQIDDKYGYDKMCNQKALNEEVICLPALTNYIPDWQYMEDYMKKVMKKSEESLKNLRRAEEKKRREVDVREWREFRVGDYFTQERGKEKAPKQNEDGECILIQETNSNNGFDRLVEPTTVIKGNAITISINYATNVFYQKDDFCASVNIAVIRNDNLNLYNGYFIASVLSSAHRKFDYQNKISKELIDCERIKLPATQDGQPDWNYMENYMKNIMQSAEQNLRALRQAIS